jgi:hypothetical protein
MAAGAANPYTLGGPKAETSAWPTPASGYTWGGGAGSVTETYQTSTYSGGKPNTTTFTWKLPTSIPADGAKGSITVNAAAGSEVWAPGFSVNGVLVGCTGITNTPSYGTGCAEGDHAAVAVSLQPGQSKSVTQDFLIKPGIGQVTVVIAGYSQQFVYTSTSNAAPATTTTASTTPRVTYLFRSEYKGNTFDGTVGATLTGSGSFSLAGPLVNGIARAHDPRGTAVLQLHGKNGSTRTVELTAISGHYEQQGSPPNRLFVVVTYKVTKSIVSCLPVGQKVSLFPREEKRGDSVGVIGACAVDGHLLPETTAAVAIKLK